MIRLIARSRAFHSAISKIILPILEENLDFKYSLDAKMNLEEEEIKRLKD